MSPPDDDRSNPLPTLSWNSIVDDDRSTSDGAVDTVSPLAPSGGDPEPVRVTMSLRLDEAPDAPPVPLPPMTGATPPPPPPPAPPGAPSAVLASTPTIGDVEPLQHAGQAAEPADPSSPAPDLSAFKLTMSPLVVADEAVEPSGYVPIEPVGDFVLPPIREATPVEPYQPEVAVPALATDPSGAGAADTSATTAVQVVDASSAAPVITLPAAQPDQSSRPVAAMSPLAIEVPQSRKPAKRRKRAGLRLVVAFVILAGIVAAAIVYGRPYLFQDDWQSNAKPYAVAVQDVTGVDFAEPVSVIAEPTASYQTGATAQLAGDWQAQLPLWRALGLASGDVTEATLDELLAAWQPAMYSTADGQIHHDEALVGADLDAALTVEMATAQLDQQYGWAIGQPERTLDDAALTSANVLAQSLAIQRQTEFDTPIETASTGPLAYLPAVIAYEVLAPSMYAPLLTPVAPDSDNPLADLGTGGPGPLAPDAPKLAGTPTLIDGDVIVATPTTEDRSFWYLVFAGYLDAPTSFAASEAVIENALTVVERSGTTCAYATFSGGDSEQTATLRSAVESWVAAVPAEFTSSFSVTPDGMLQMSSCDPGTQVTGTNRLGVARELIGWRSAEIATITGVAAAGGSDADVAGALFRLVQSDAGAQLAASPVNDSPAAAADAARAAVASVVTPPPPPPVEPEG